MASTISAIDIDALLKKMTIEEKCGQMNEITFAVIQKSPPGTDPDDDQIDDAKLEDAIQKYHVGGIHNTPLDTAQKASTWQKIQKKIQEAALKGKNKIPILYAIESIHGTNYIREGTLFPQAIGMASTFNLDLSKEVSRITSVETRATGIPWNYNPVLDVGRQQVWSRLWETYGEDSWLTTKMGEGYIEGHQGKDNDLKSRNNTAACIKHYVGYSVPTSGRDRTPALIPEILLREHFLPPFEAAVKAGAITVMVNSAEVNGVPGHANGMFHFILLLPIYSS
jgi:beta-glucosidase